MKNLCAIGGTIVVRALLASLTRPAKVYQPALEILALDDRFVA